MRYVRPVWPTRLRVCAHTRRRRGPFPRRKRFAGGSRTAPIQFFLCQPRSLSKEMAKKSKKAAPEEEAPKKKGKKKAAAKK